MSEDLLFVLKEIFALNEKLLKLTKQPLSVLLDSNQEFDFYEYSWYYDEHYDNFCKYSLKNETLNYLLADVQPYYWDLFNDELNIEVKEYLKDELFLILKSINRLLEEYF